MRKISADEYIDCFGVGALDTVAATTTLEEGKVEAADPTGSTQLDAGTVLVAAGSADTCDKAGVIRVAEDKGTGELAAFGGMVCTEGVACGPATEFTCAVKYVELAGTELKARGAWWTAL